MIQASLYYCHNRMDRTTAQLLSAAAAGFLSVQEKDGGLAGDLSGKLQYDENGRPFLPASVPICFSISHSGNTWSCLIADAAAGRVGLDIQRESDADYYRIAKRFFTANELDYVKKAGKCGFYRLWCRKEAYTKYFGLPLGRTIGKVELASAAGLYDTVNGVRFAEYDLSDGLYTAAALPADCRIELRIKEL